MKEYMKTYSVMDECGAVSSMTLGRACGLIEEWINSEFSDILTAKAVELNYEKGYWRVEIYAKGSSKLGFFFGSYSASSQYVCTGYLCNDTALGGGAADNVNYVYFGGWNNSKPMLDELTEKTTLLQLELIQGDYGYAVDFTAPSINNDKKIMYVKCDDVTMSLYADKFYIEKNGEYYAPALTLLPQSGFSQKVLSRLALPTTGILPEHLYLSDGFVGSNKPYWLNGKVYTDILFGSKKYMGFALELGEG